MGSNLPVLPVRMLESVICGGYDICLALKDRTKLNLGVIGHMLHQVPPVYRRI